MHDKPVDEYARLRPTQFKPGQSGNPSGRVTNAERLGKQLNELGFDPILEAVRRYRDPRTPNASKDFCLGLVMDRVLPKLKSVEVKRDNATTQTIINILSGNVPVVAQPIIDAQPPDLQLPVDTDDENTT